jgi:hypothetical protein
MLYTLGSLSSGARGAVKTSVCRKVVGRANRLIRYFPGLVAIVVVLMTFGFAQAADPPAQFGIRPANPGSDKSTSGYFVLKANPGETLHDSVVIANPGTIPVSILLYPVDAATGDSGGAVYLNNSDARKDVGSWVTLDASQVDVPPSQQATVSFTIAVPAGARGGDHLGGIVAELARAPTPTPGAAGSNAQAGFGVTTVTRAVTAVLLTVGSAGTPSLKITGAKTVELAGYPTLVLSLQNDGSALVKPQGTVSLTDAAGKTALSTQLKIDTVVPQTSIDYPVQVDLPAQAGTYQVHASLDYGGTAPAVLEGSVVVAAPAPDATAVVVGGRTRAPLTNQVGATVPSGLSPIVLVLAGVLGTLLIVAIGLGLNLWRSRRRSK